MTLFRGLGSFVWGFVLSVAMCAQGVADAQQTPKAPPKGPPEPVPAAAKPFDNDPTLDLSEPSNPAPRNGQAGDWNEAAIEGDEGVSNIIRAHWVHLTSAGEVVGRISTINPKTLRLEPTPGLQIRFVQDGQSRGQSETGATGQFVATGLSPGVYTLVASGPRGFIAYSLNLLPSAAAGSETRAEPLRPLNAEPLGALDAEPPRPLDVVRLVQLEEAEESLEIDTAAVPPTFSTLKAIVRDYYDEFAEEVVGDDKFKEMAPVDRQENRPGIEQVEGAERRRGSTELKTNPPTARDATSIRHHQVPLLPDGRLVGRLYGVDQLTGRPRMIEDVNVFIIQDDRIAAQVKVDKYGVFTAKGLEPGSYSIIAAGHDGFGAVGFQLAKAEGDLQSRNRLDASVILAVNRSRIEDLWRPVQMPAGGMLPSPFAMALVDDPRDIRAAFNAMPPMQALAMDDSSAEMPPPAPMGGAPMGGAPGGMSGGSSGGGGGGGGMGSLAGLAALGGLGGLAALSGNNNTPPIVVSPFSPVPPVQQ